jgi:hypothetical protein
MPATTQTRLTNKPSKPTAAFLNGRVTVRLAGGVFCPLCDRELAATDVDVDLVNLSVTLRCCGCHRDVMEIERHR